MSEIHVDPGHHLNVPFVMPRLEAEHVQALVLKDFNHMVLEERPVPTPPDGDILIQTIVTGVCGSDLHGFTGHNGRRVPGQIMGHETAGRVAGIGPNVTGLDIGDLVTMNPLVIPSDDAGSWIGREHHHPRKFIIGVEPTVVAAFAQFFTLPARNVVKLPAGMPVEHGALVEPIAVAVHAVRRVDTRSVSSVLIVGGGPIGQSLVVVLKQLGIPKVLVSEIDPFRRELVQRLGGIVLDPGAGALADQVVGEIGSTVDITFDAVGLTRTLYDALSSTSHGGTVCLVGMGEPLVQLHALAVTTAERSLIGSFAYSTQDFLEAVQIVSQSKHAAELISKVVALKDAPGTFAALAEGDGTPGKVLVRLADA